MAVGNADRFGMLLITAIIASINRAAADCQVAITQGCQAAFRVCCWAARAGGVQKKRRLRSLGCAWGGHVGLLFVIVCVGPTPREKNHYFHTSRE